jgi:hypothetical protein
MAGKIKLEVNKVELQKMVTDLEAKQEFANLSKLWSALEATDWAKNQKPRPLTVSVISARAKELGIILKTVAGKKGATLGSKIPRGERIPRSEKFKKFDKTFEIMAKEVPEQYRNLIDKIKGGSMKSALKLKCLDCSAWDIKEVRGCVCTGCSLFPFRPGANKKVVADVPESEDDAGEGEE